MPNRTERHREAIRMGLLVQERLADAQEWNPLTIPETDWRECQRLARLSEKAVKMQCFRAAARIRPRLTRALRDLKESLDRTLREHFHQATPPCPSLKELYAELLGLFDEFPNADCNLRNETLSVTTESVILEDVYLGPFRIELDVERGGVGLAYSVIAVDPHPAATNEEITHPHVQNSQLCEGEGRLPIQSALREGRLCDFFQIVTQILETYNPASAYVALDEWGGVSCADCGRSACEDERTHCAASDEMICYECAVTCPDCDSDFCREFTSLCDKCEERYCDRCLEGGLCDACQKEAQQKEISREQCESETGSRGCGGDSERVDSAEPLGAVIV